MNVPHRHVRCVALLWTLACTTATSAPGQDRLLRRPFDRFDRDKDGVITAKEFPGDAGIYRAMDRDKDGRVTFDEYKVSVLAKRYLAARRADRNEPRRRKSIADLARRRLEHVMRFDTNRDRKVTKREWTGDPDAFRALDLDGNGWIDRKDRSKAKAEAELLSKSLNELPDIKVKLEGVDATFHTYDRNMDAQLTRKEARRAPFLPAFDYADRNEDGVLDRREVQYLITLVNGAVNARNLGYARAKAPVIPFKSWDKNKDGRVDIKEWIEKKYLFKRMDLNRDAAVTEEELLRYKRAFEGHDFLSKFDLNGDHKVTRKEFAGSRAAFDRADRNGDGVISARDR